eukprot:Gb_26643 [translate_table: standard]
METLGEQQNSSDEGHQERNSELQNYLREGKGLGSSYWTEEIQEQRRRSSNGSTKDERSFKLSTEENQERTRRSLSWPAEQNQGDERIRRNPTRRGFKAVVFSSLHNSMKRKRPRRSDSGLTIEDIRNPIEQEAVQLFRELLLKENLLPEKHDDYHNLLRDTYGYTEIDAKLEAQGKHKKQDIRTTAENCWGNKKLCVCAGPGGDSSQSQNVPQLCLEMTDFPKLWKVGHIAEIAGKCRLNPDSAQKLPGKASVGSYTPA